MTGLARSVKSDIGACYEALKHAKYPQIYVFIATSRFTGEFKFNKTKEEIAWNDQRARFLRSLKI